MAKSRKPATTSRRRKQTEPAAEVPAGYVLVDEAPASETPDIVKLEIARLKSLSRVIERHLECLSCNERLGDLTAGEVGDLAGLLHARLVALDAAMWNT